MQDDHAWSPQAPMLDGDGCDPGSAMTVVDTPALTMGEAADADEGLGERSDSVQVGRILRSA